MNHCVASHGRSFERSRNWFRANDRGGRTAVPPSYSRLARDCTLLLAVLAAPGQAGTGQTGQLENPVRFWQHESEYTGSRACKPCHADIYSRQSTSNHARSLRQAELVPELVGALPFSRFDRVSGYTLALSSNSASRVRLESANDAESSGATLDWAFGSGAKGITPIGRTDRGRLGGEPADMVRERRCDRLHNRCLEVRSAERHRKPRPGPDRPAGH